MLNGSRGGKGQHDWPSVLPVGQYTCDRGKIMQQGDRNSSARRPPCTSPTLIISGSNCSGLVLHPARGSVRRVFHALPSTLPPPRRRYPLGPAYDRECILTPRLGSLGGSVSLAGWWAHSQWFLKWFLPKVAQAKRLWIQALTRCV